MSRFVLHFDMYHLACEHISEILATFISFYICVLIVPGGIHSEGSDVPPCTITFAHLLIPKFMPMSLLKMSTVPSKAFDSIYIVEHSLRSFMYRKWLSFCPHFNLYPNVVRFNTQRVLCHTKEDGDRAYPWNITNFILVFAKRPPHAFSSVFHAFLDSRISLIVVLLTQCSSIAHCIYECDGLSSG